MFEMNIIKQRLNADKNKLILLRFRRIFLLVSIVCLTGLMYRYFTLLGKVAMAHASVVQGQRDIANSRQANAISDLEREWTKHLNEINRASRVAGERTFWSGRLALLSQSLPPGVCINGIKVAVSQADQSKKILMIETLILSRDKQGYELANSFIEQLKKTKQFGEEIRVDNQERSNIDGKEMETVRIAVNL